MTTTPRNHHGVPLYAKTVMAVQFLFILFFGFWMYQEYQYNTFFQAYVNGFVNDNMLVLITICAVLGFLGSGIGMYVRAHGRVSSLEFTGEDGNGSSTTHEPSMKGGKLDTHTEQRLIDMIRKTVPAPSGGGSTPAGSAGASSGQSLPTLQRVDTDKRNP